MVVIHTFVFTMFSIESLYECVSLRQSDAGNGCLPSLFRWRAEGESPSIWTGGKTLAPHMLLANVEHRMLCIEKGNVLIGFDAIHPQAIPAWILGIRHHEVYNCSEPGNKKKESNVRHSITC